MLIAMAVALALFSTAGPRFNVSFAQASPTGCGATIQFLNPSTGTSKEISSKSDGSDTTYHLVAWVSRVPNDATVEFKYQAGSANEVTIGTADQTPGSPDTFELDWNLAGVPEGTGTANNVTLRARLFSGSTECSRDEETVRINNDDPPSCPAANCADETQAETIEMSYPDNGDVLGFYKPLQTAQLPTSIIDVTMSDEVDEVDAYYTTSGPGTEPEWEPCAENESADDSADGVRCEYEDANPDQVNAVAVVVNDVNEPTEIPPLQPNPDTSDAHRVEPYQQVVTTTEIPSGQATQAIAPGAGGEFPCSSTIVVTTLDQEDRKVAGVNLDVHARGPSDATGFDDSPAPAPSPGTASYANKAPDQGNHTNEAGVNCEAADPEPGSGSGSSQGEHEAPPPAFDTKHIESTANTDDAGQWGFQLHSDVAGLTEFLVFADEDDDDQYCSLEPGQLGSITWDSGGSPSGFTADKSSCTRSGPTGSPSPTSTASPSPTSTGTQSPTPTPTETSPSPSPEPETRRVATTVTIKRRPPSFKGRVRSSEPRCRRGRAVKLKKKKSGRDRTVGTDRTNRRGRWNRRVRRARGRYYAVVKPKRFTESDGDIVICRRGESETIRVRR